MKFIRQEKPNIKISQRIQFLSINFVTKCEKKYLESIRGDLWTLEVIFQYFNIFNTRKKIHYGMKRFSLPAIHSHNLRTVPNVNMKWQHISESNNSFLLEF